MRKNILITGMPRSGKSTLLGMLVLDHPDKVGFVTDEVRENGERIGFEMVSHRGNKQMLASIDIDSPHKVSKYFVDVESLDKMVESVESFDDNDLLFLDEIGQMELLSNKFKKLCLSYLDSPNVCIATISKIYSDEFIESIKKRKDVILIEITPENRDTVGEFAGQILSKVLKAKVYLREPQRFTREGNKFLIESDHAMRTVNVKDKNLTCDCDFYKENSICSHVLAVEEKLGL